MIWVLDKCIDWRQGVHVHQIGMVGPIQIGATGHWRDSYALWGHMCVMCMQLQRSCCLIFYHVNIVWKPCDSVMCIPYGGKEVPYICICMYMWMPLTNACLSGFIWLHHHLKDTINIGNGPFSLPTREQSTASPQSSPWLGGRQQRHPVAHPPGLGM